MSHITETPGKAARFSRGTKLSLAGAVGAVALGVGAVVALPALTASPAYAVDPNGDGTLRVAVNSAEDAEGLKDELADYGVRATVDFPPDEYMCDPDRYTPSDELDGALMAESMFSPEHGSSLVFEVDPKDYDPDSGNTLVIEISEGHFADAGSDTAMLALGSAQGEVGECDPVPADEVGPPEGAEEEEFGTNENKDDDGSRSTDED